MQDAFLVCVSACILCALLELKFHPYPPFMFLFFLPVLFEKKPKPNNNNNKNTKKNTPSIGTATVRPCIFVVEQKNAEVLLRI